MDCTTTVGSRCYTWDGLSALAWRHAQRSYFQGQCGQHRYHCLASFGTVTVRYIRYVASSPENGDKMQSWHVADSFIASFPLPGILTANAR